MRQPGPGIVKRRVGEGTTVWAASAHIDSLVEAGIASPAVFINRHASSIIDDVTKSKITSVSVNLEGRVFKVAAKEYLPRGGAAAFKNLFRPSKARVELLLSARLTALGIPVPEPVAAVEIRSFRLLKKAYLFNQEIVGGASLLQLLDAQEHTRLSRKQLTAVIGAVAAVVAAAHEKGLYHGDLNASHLILRDWKSDTPGVYFIDFENSRIRKTVSMQERLRDIGRLERSASYFLPVKERLRFLRTYVGAAGHGTALRDWVSQAKLEVARRTR
jgi:tRNA A-37 threonylcarbamoyl transferase component Bud32